MRGNGRRTRPSSCCLTLGAGLFYAYVSPWVWVRRCRQETREVFLVVGPWLVPLSHGPAVGEAPDDTKHSDSIQYVEGAWEGCRWDDNFRLEAVSVKSLEFAAGGCAHVIFGSSITQYVEGDNPPPGWDVPDQSGSSFGANTALVPNKTGGKQFVCVSLT